MPKGPLTHKYVESRSRYHLFDVTGRVIGVFRADSEAEWMGETEEFLEAIERLEDLLAADRIVQLLFGGKTLGEVETTIRRVIGYQHDQRSDK